MHPSRMTTASINPKDYTPCPVATVAFLGLGVMGYPMAGHLAQAGHAVTVYNRTATKSIAWCTEFSGANTTNVSHAPTPRQAALGADIVFCCVGNDDDLRLQIKLNSQRSKADISDTGGLASAGLAPVN